MISIVIDTNVLVSALLKPESFPAAVLMLSLAGEVRLCLSAPIYAEYDEVIRRPRFKRTTTLIDATLSSLRGTAHWVVPTVQVTECMDPDDNMFLECAQAAHADYLVTGNQRHFPKRWKRTLIIEPREFVELLIQQT